MTVRELDGAVIAVLGASGGLGRPIAADLTARGSRLLLVSRNSSTLADVGGVEAAHLSLDIGMPTAGDELVECALEAFGRLDGVVNAAGVVAFGPLLETPDRVIEDLFRVNVIGPLLLMRRVIPLLTESKGFFLNISAVVAETPMAGLAAYSATKAALRAADQALTRELRRAGITVTDVRPPHTETGLANRPVAGVAPALPAGLDPALVASRIVNAIASGATDVPSGAFT